MQADDEFRWRTVAQHRIAIADLLATLTETEWETPSLCAGWRVRDVAAHLLTAPDPPSPGQMLRAFTRARGRYNLMVDDLTRQYATRPGLAADLRAAAPSRTLPKVTNIRNILFDTLVHGQDIAIPLGRSLPIPPEAAALAATRVWEMGWPFWARRRLRGFRLSATDIDWTAGAGHPIEGPMTALLLLVTGRPIAVEQLAGDGLSDLKNSMREWPSATPVDPS
ncbi:maleylpyruvate isomerase family mycothiol-dependent enzyme [Nocardia sp. NPDC004068]|uniref:maleylpyruvate isomerase family mycothiol-dependent enzyme n=1 Tax=Nocardia sp. NPDC004068 TaxID=3364303 RepID=UPI0036847B38